MSDPNLNTKSPTLKALDEKISKLAPIIDELDMIAFQFKKLSHIIEHIDTLVLKLRERYEELRDYQREKK
ncbi:MAG: hypothetical protein K2P93_05560 [Alphaproteobacteria bacterium]|nr:hypothetical protein [Alphaproteobacteria bacterium]